MSNLPHPVVAQAAYLTLHYRLGAVEGADLITTFAGNPATLQLGQGQLAPFLEERLLGLPEGAHQIFEFTPEQAFGPRNPELVQRVSRAALNKNSLRNIDYKVGDLVNLAGPQGGSFTGVLREIDEQDAVLDFNHPLAGQSVRFEVKIIGIL